MSTLSDNIAVKQTPLRNLNKHRQKKQIREGHGGEMGCRGDRAIERRAEERGQSHRGEGAERGQRMRCGQREGDRDGGAEGWSENMGERERGGWTRRAREVGRVDNER